ASTSGGCACERPQPLWRRRLGAERIPRRPCGFNNCWLSLSADCRPDVRLERVVIGGSKMGEPRLVDSLDTVRARAVLLATSGRGLHSAIPSALSVTRLGHDAPERLD